MQSARETGHGWAAGLTNINTRAPTHINFLLAMTTPIFIWSLTVESYGFIINPAIKLTNLRHPALDPGSTESLDSSFRWNEDSTCI